MLSQLLLRMLKHDLLVKGQRHWSAGSFSPLPSPALRRLVYHASIDTKDAKKRCRASRILCLFLEP